jgi:hypothetical protein
MTISAQLSLYPLRQEHLSPAIQAVREAFSRRQHPMMVGAICIRLAIMADAGLASGGLAWMRWRGGKHHHGGASDLSAD